jgi:hypothetical protein
MFGLLVFHLICAAAAVANYFMHADAAAGVSELVYLLNKQLSLTLISQADGLLLAAELRSFY